MLLLPRWLSRQILDHAERELPREACGLLVGLDSPPTRHAVDWVPARNTNPKPTQRFDLEPECLLRTHRLARELGLEIVALVHSHPGGHARPSRLDERFAWPRLSSVIVGQESGRWVLRSFHLTGARLQEEPVAVDFESEAPTTTHERRGPARAVPQPAAGAPT